MPGVMRGGRCRRCRPGPGAPWSRTAARRPGPGVAEAGEQVAQLLGGQQVEQHEDVGLLADLVAVRCVPFGGEDEVEPADVAVAVGVAGEIEGLQGVVAVELADDAVVVEGHVHAAGDLAPALQLSGVDAQAGRKVATVAAAQQLDDVQGAAQQPHRHHVGVGVVAQPGGSGGAVAVVELVRAHHSGDLVPPAGGVDGGQVCEESGDVEDELGAGPTMKSVSAVAW
jgi:hypothetical protein